MQSANAQLSVKMLDTAINQLKGCEKKLKAAGEDGKMKCGFRALSPVLDQLDQAALDNDRCIDSELQKNNNIKDVHACSVWMKSLKKGLKKIETPVNQESNPQEKVVSNILEGQGNTKQEPVIPSSQGASSTQEQPASTPEQKVSNSNNVPNQKQVPPNTNDAAAAASKGQIEEASNTYLSWILGLLVILLTALVFVLYLKLNKLTVQFSDNQMKRVLENKKKDEEIRQLASDRDRAFRELEASERASASQKSVVAADAAVSTPRVVAPVAVVEPEPPVMPKTKVPQLSRLSVQQAVLKAIEELANERVSLTEANFVSKIIGSIANPDIKAALAGNLEPGLFFVCGGMRSAQSPELLAYRLKGAGTYEVVPFPTAGRVGQFMNWYENAVGSYEVDPVLASKPAIGTINEAGVLSVSQKGTLA